MSVYGSETNTHGFVVGDGYNDVNWNHVIRDQKFFTNNGKKYLIGECITYIGTTQSKKLNSDGTIMNHAMVRSM